VEDEQFEDDFVVPSGSPDFRSELAAQLAELAPEVIADGKVDVAKLQELLGEDVADSAERFGLFWPGKKNALRVAQAPTTATLRPDIENSKDWDTTQNVFIEGDNLEVLKILQKHYHNKIKMIYIDPPYNTGKDFVYPDNFKEGLDSYLQWTRQVNEEGKKLSTNSETEGRYHSNWLNMMYPRLKLARNLLTDDGIILISIDDNEYENLKRLCVEVFGDSNYIGTFIWKKKGTSTNVAGAQMSALTEFVVAFARDASRLPLNPRIVSSSERKYPLKDEEGCYRATIVEKKSTGDYDRASMKFEILGVSPRPGKRWQLGLDKARELEAQGRFILENNIVKLKIYEHEDADSTSANPNLLLDKGSTQSGQSEVNNLMGGHLFDTPKPTSLLQHLTVISSKPDSVILDFFAGSASTAHAVMALNAEDGGNRKFVMVQLPEPTPEGSEARKAGYETIADISRERIRRAGASILAERDGQFDAGEKPLDVGFRSYKLNASNFAKWQVTSDIEPGKLGEHLMTLRGSADDHATPNDLLTEVLLKQGSSLTEQISKVDIAGLELYSVGDGLVLAYLDEHVKPTLEQFRDVVDAGPSRLIVLEDAYQGDDQLKTNLEQLCRSKSIELWRA
jgi:adenine-specific DNA-methyltransferase